MKLAKKLGNFGAGLVVATGMMLGVARAEPLSIVGYETDAGLAFAGATDGNYYTLEFAPTAAGPWTNWGSVSEHRNGYYPGLEGGNLGFRCARGL